MRWNFTKTLAVLTILLISSLAQAGTVTLNFTAYTSSTSDGTTPQASGYITFDEDTFYSNNRIVGNGGICGDESGSIDNSLDYQITFSGGAIDGLVFNKSNCFNAPQVCVYPNSSGAVPPILTDWNPVNFGYCEIRDGEDLVQLAKDPNYHSNNEFGVYHAGSGIYEFTTQITSVVFPDNLATAPTNLVATAGDGQVSIAFTAPSSDGGSTITDYQYQLDSGAWTSASTATSPVVITGLTNGTTYSVKLRAINAAGHGAESAAVSILTSTPASEFAAKKDAIRQVLVDDAQHSLSATLGANRRMTQQARTRLSDSRSQMTDKTSNVNSRKDPPLDVHGTLKLDDKALKTRGHFFDQTALAADKSRRLFFGDFDIQRDGNSGTTMATVSTRMAWERMLTTPTLLGYFVGGDLAYSSIEGIFMGNQGLVRGTVGAYSVHALDKHLFLDGFLTLGASRNNLHMADSVLQLDSSYTASTATIGAALSGIYDFKQYELRPELALSYGRTWIGETGFTAYAYGLTDNTLSLNAGHVSLVNLTLRPQVIWALDADTVAKSKAQLSFSPRLVCENRRAVQRTQYCGGGAEFGLNGTSEDRSINTELRVIMDRIGQSTRSSLLVNFEYWF